MSKKETQTPLSDLVLTKDDFDQCNWQDAIAGCKRNDCLDYFSSFSKRASQAEESGETACHNVFAILSVLCFPLLRGDSKDTPLAPLSTIELLSREQLEVLQELVPEISDAELRARIADIIWIRKRDHKMAECAVKCYLASSDVLEQAGEGAFIRDRIERALRLAISLNNDRLLSIVTSHIESLLRRCDDDHCETPTLLLMKTVRDYRKILQPHQRMDPSEYAGLAERAAKRQESSHWLVAQQHWSIAAAWHLTSGDSEAAREAEIRAAETYVKASEDAINKRIRPSYLVAHHLLQQALTAYAVIPGTEERVKELHTRLIEYGKKTLAEMHMISTELELDQATVERARNRVKGKTVHEALLALAFSVPPPSVAYLKKTALDAIEAHPAAFLFQRKTFNELGKVVAWSPSGVFDDTEREATARAEMFRHAQLVQQVNVASVIEPARRQINLEHDVRVDDLYPLLINNPFIPLGREAIFARGLYYGLTGDFLLSTHLLIPQVENSIRSLLDRQGEIASTLDSRGIQQERDLNRLLYKPYAPLLEHILGEDLIFDLRGFLVEEEGSNLRNKLAHGLIDYSAFSAGQHSYLWWIVLHLCCRPLLSNALLENRLQEASSEESGENMD
jgi:hypothetical protein